jgi:hypothetical protein
MYVVRYIYTKPSKFYVNIDFIYLNSSSVIVRQRSMLQTKLTYPPLFSPFIRATVHSPFFHHSTSAVLLLPWPSMDATGLD